MKKTQMKYCPRTPNSLTVTGFLRRGERYSTPATQSNVIDCYYCDSASFSLLLVLLSSLSLHLIPSSAYFSSSSSSSSSSCPHSFLSPLLAFPLSKWIVISHYPAQRLYARGSDRSSLGMKEHDLCSKPGLTGGLGEPRLFSSTEEEELQKVLGLT